MGSLLSKSPPPPAPEQKRILSNGSESKSPTAASGEPLFLDEVKVEPAVWSEESLCRTIQRFFGLLPDSPVRDINSLSSYKYSSLTLAPGEQGEVLKKEQQYPMFRRRSAYDLLSIVWHQSLVNADKLFYFLNRAFVFNVGARMGVILVIQRLYRRYRRMRSWHEVGDHMLQLARDRLAVQRAQEQENISAASFRLLLVEGFSASKVCISGL